MPSISFYDSIKILILLFSIGMVMGVVNAYFPIDKLRRYLTARKLRAAIPIRFGCSGDHAILLCSSIPLFIGFVKGGIPLGVTFAFLITSPLVNEVAVAMFLGSFGLRAMVIMSDGILLGTIGVLYPSPSWSDTFPWVRQLQGSRPGIEAWAEKHCRSASSLRAMRGALFRCPGLCFGRHGVGVAMQFVRKVFRAIWRKGCLRCPGRCLRSVMYHAAGIVPVIQVFVARYPAGTVIAFMMGVGLRCLSTC
ncbi:MAG: permease [Alistipes sp.]